MRASAVLIVVAGLSGSVAASAATFKCEVAGKITYSDAPCVIGRQSELMLPALAPDADAQRAAQAREAADIQRADKAVENARKRNDADAKRRAEIAIAEKKAEEARLKKEAADAKKEAVQRSKAAKSKGFTAKGSSSGSAGAAAK